MSIDVFDPSEISEDEVDAAWAGLWAWEQIGGAGNLLAFDLGSLYAWALLTDGRVTMSGWYETKRKGEGGGAELLRFRHSMIELLDHADPTAIAWEAPAPKAHGSAAIIRQSGMLMAECTARQIAYTQINPSSLKKWATGKGNASKDLMREVLVQRCSP